MIYKYQLAQITSKRIKQFRKSKSLTQSDLASMLNVQRSTLANWEAGHRIPSVDQYCELAYLLDCTLDQLVKTDEQLEPQILETDEYNIDSLDLTRLNETEKKYVIDLYNSIIKNGSFYERRNKFPRLEDSTPECVYRSK